MQKSSSSGALSSSSSGAGSRTQRGGSSASRAPTLQVRPEPIPIRGRKGVIETSSTPVKVPREAAAALASAVASLTGGSAPAAMVSAAVAAAENGVLQEQLAEVTRRLQELDSERIRIAESGLSVLARCSSDGALRAVATPAGPSSFGVSALQDMLATASRSPASCSAAEVTVSPRSRASTLDGLDKHPWLLADGRLLTARLEGENLALKRAVQRARTEIGELMKGRELAEARVRSLHEENSAAAEALRRCTGTGAFASKATESSMPGAAEAAAGVASGKLGTSQRANALLETPPQPRGGAPGDTAAGGSWPSPGAGGGDSGGGCTSPVSQSSARDEQARTKLIQASDEICRRMEELLSRRGKKLQAVLDAEGGQGAQS